MFGKVKSFVQSKVTSSKALITMALMSIMTALACVSVGAEGETGADVSTAVSSATSVMSSVFTLITSNPFLLVFMGFSILMVALRVFKKSGKAAKI